MAQDLVAVDESKNSGIHNYYSLGKIISPQNTVSVIFSGTAQVSFHANEISLNDGFRVIELSENGYFIANSEMVTSSSNTNNWNTTNMESLQTFPNPAKEKLNIGFKEEQPFSFSLFNIVGHEVLEGTHKGPSEIDVSKFNSGIYFLEVTTDEEVPKKFLKKIFIESNLFILER